RDLDGIRPKRKMALGLWPRAVRFLSALLQDAELRFLLQRLTADMIAHANFQRVITRNQLTRINQSRERQPLTGVTVTTPVLGLLAEFLAVSYQRVFDID